MVDKLREVTQFLKAKITKDEVQELLLSATSDQNWQTSTSILHQLADAAYNREEWNKVFAFIQEKLKMNKWRKIMKTLNLIDFLLKNGPSHIINDLRQLLHDIKNFEYYNCVEDKVDRGEAIKAKSKSIIELLTNSEALDQQRNKAKLIKQRLSGSSNTGYGAHGSGSSGYGGMEYKNMRSSKNNTSSDTGFSASAYFGMGSTTSYQKVGESNSGTTTRHNKPTWMDDDQKPQAQSMHAATERPKPVPKPLNQGSLFQGTRIVAKPKPIARTKPEPVVEKPKPATAIDIISMLQDGGSTVTATSKPPVQQQNPANTLLTPSNLTHGVNNNPPPFIPTLPIGQTQPVNQPSPIAPSFYNVPGYSPVPPQLNPTHNNMYNYGMPNTGYPNNMYTGIPTMQQPLYAPNSGVTMYSGIGMNYGIVAPQAMPQQHQPTAAGFNLLASNAGLSSAMTASNPVKPQFTLTLENVTYPIKIKQLNHFIHLQKQQTTQSKPAANDLSSLIDLSGFSEQLKSSSKKQQKQPVGKEPNTFGLLNIPDSFESINSSNQSTINWLS